MVWQLKVTLRDVTPTVWRRVLVHDVTTVEQLHAILQAIMGWGNYHLWEFTIGGKPYAAPGIEGAPVTGVRSKLVSLRLQPGDAFEYLYDPGDGWEHEVVLEASSAPKPDMILPLCVAGERACPPEDCGGPPGYESLLEILRDPDHPEYKETLEWVPVGFQPEIFDVPATNRILELTFG